MLTSVESMSPVKVKRLTLPFSDCEMTIANNRLLKLRFTDRAKLTALDDVALSEQESTFYHHINNELNNYLQNPHHVFNLPFYLQGTPFQQRVWEALRAIPCGETYSYMQLAQKLQTSPRAVGNACRANPIPIIIPCHRIVAKQGIGGYAGQSQSGKMIDIKKWLLLHEA